MSVLRTIRAIAADGQTEMLALNLQDGGNAAEIICVQDWRTASELTDIATACTRMAAVITQYQANPDLSNATTNVDSGGA